MTNDNDVVIELRDVKKSFRLYHSQSVKDVLIALTRMRSITERRHILRGVDLSIRKGERVAIIGKNGAGKSTLFRLLSKILVADSGVIRVIGRVSPLIEVTAGFVPDMTGAENIRLNAALLGLPRREVEQRFSAIAEFAEITDFLDTPLRYYSSGMQARLGFSIAVHVDADILLVDEVLAVGDARFQERCIAKMKELSDKQCTVVFVSHDEEAVRRFCSRAILLSDGKVTFDGDVQQALHAMHRVASEDTHAR